MSWFRIRCTLFLLSVFLAVPASATEPPLTPEPQKNSPLPAGDLDQATTVTGPISNKVPGLTLPENQEWTVNKRTIILHAQADGPVRWMIFNQVPGNEPEALQLPASHTLILFPSSQPDVLVVVAYTSINNQPSDPARTLIAIKPNPEPGPAPNPAPAPAPTPPSTEPKRVKGPLNLSLIVDYTRQTAELAAVINDAVLQKQLTDAGYKRWVLDVKSENVTAGGLDDGVKRAGGVPAIVIQDGSGNIIDAGPLKDADSVRQLAAKYIGG